MDFDAMPGWRQLDVPVLVLKGGNDDRSDARRVIAAFEAALDRGQTRLLPGADHMLLHWPLGERVPPPRFAAGYPQLIAQWINGRFRFLVVVTIRRARHPPINPVGSGNHGCEALRHCPGIGMDS